MTHINDGCKRTPEQKHLIREMAARCYLDGESTQRIAASYGVSTVSVWRWGQVAKKNGLQSLQPKPSPGRSRSLSPEQE